MFLVRRPAWIFAIAAGLVAACSAFSSGDPPDAFGVIAYSTATRAVAFKANDPVFAIAVDDDGLYWGVHAGGANAGVVKMLRKNKMLPKNP